MARRPPDIHGMTSLKVDNLTYRTTMDDLRHHFGKFGEIGDIYIPRDNYTMESRGFAFVRYYDKRDAEDAIDSMDGKVVDGRELRCAMAKYGRPDTERDSRRGRGGGRYGGYGGYGGSRGGDRGYRSRRDRSRSRSRSRSRRSRSRSRSRSRRYDRSNSRKSDGRKSTSPARDDSPRRSADNSPRRDSRSLSRSASRSRSNSR